MVSVYNFSLNGSVPFANFGWVGIVGSLAGFSPLIGIGERLWGDKGKESEFGMPWMYVLRDVLQYATDLESGVGIMMEAKKTWAIHVALSSKVDNELEIVYYTADALIVQSRENQTQPCSNASLHYDVPGLIYIDTNAPDGECSTCVSGLLEENYGNLNA